MFGPRIKSSEIFSTFGFYLFHPQISLRCYFSPILSSLPLWGLTWFRNKRNHHRYESGLHQPSFPYSFYFRKDSTADRVQSKSRYKRKSELEERFTSRINTDQKQRQNLDTPRRLDWWTLKWNFRAQEICSCLLKSRDRGEKNWDKEGGKCMW